MGYICFLLFFLFKDKFDLNNDIFFLVIRFIDVYILIIINYYLVLNILISLVFKIVLIKDLRMLNFVVFF